MAGPGDVAAQLFARLGQGVVKPAAALTDLIGMDKTAANLRARDQLLEDILPRPESTLGKIGAGAAEAVPSLLAAQVAMAGAAPHAIKGVGALARRIPAISKYLDEARHVEMVRRAADNPVLPSVNIFGP